MLQGSITAVVTPFLEDGSINYEKLGQLLNFQIENRSDGIVILGTTGEASTLSKEEKIKVFKYTVKHVNKRVPVIAGTGSNNTLESVEFTKEVSALGVDYCLVVSPYYNKTNVQGYINHFSLIADASEVPLMLYNVPSRTGDYIPLEAIEVLSKHENIYALKEASSNLSYAAKASKYLSKDFIMLSGNDDVVLPYLSLGAKGVVSVVSNIIPCEFHDMVKFYLNKDFDKSLEIQKHYLDLISGLFVETNPIPIKTIMNIIGHNVGGFRAPLYEASNETKASLKDLVSRYKL